MQVILLKDVEKLGKRGELVNVRDGFGRNFLIPRTLALPATPENRFWAEKRKKLEAGRKAHQRDDAEKLAQTLTATPLRFEVVVGEKEKIFGSVTAQEVAEALVKQGFSIDKKQIRLAEPLRSLGKHRVSVELAPEVKVTLEIEIAKKSAHAKS